MTGAARGTEPDFSGWEANQDAGSLYPVPRDFFAKDPVFLARELLGRILEVGPCRGIIVEAEAYADDPASHAVTRRPSAYDVMCTAGRLYVYRVHMQLCLNLTCGREGRPGAVLLRAVRPVAGLATMYARRLRRNPRLRVDPARPSTLANLASGPGRLCQAFDVRLEWSGLPVGREVRILEGRRAERAARGPRIGISRAQELPWRFFLPGDPFVTPPRRGERAP